jgi:Golgi phosphoprotein 3
MLTLPEEMLLLAIHQDKGTYIGAAADRLKVGLAGALLTQLALHGNIEVDKNHRVNVLNTEPTGDDLVNEALATMKESEKARKVGYWISTFAPKADSYRKRIIERLVEKDILTVEEDHLNWVVPSPYHPEGVASTKYWLKRRLREIVLAQQEGSSAEVAFLSLVRAVDLLDLVFLKDERRMASNIINELLVRSAMTDPLCQSVQEIESTIQVVVEED